MNDEYWTPEQVEVICSALRDGMLKAIQVGREIKVVMTAG